MNDDDDDHHHHHHAENGAALEHPQSAVRFNYGSVVAISPNHPSPPSGPSRVSPAWGADPCIASPPEGEGPSLRGGVGAVQGVPVAGKGTSLRPPHPGTRSPLRGPGGIYRPGPELLALPGHPPAPALGPGLWGDQGGVGPGCRWRGVGLAGWLWGGAGSPLFTLFN